MPEERLEVVILSCVGEITIVKLADLNCAGLLLSVTEATKANAPATAGVPETTPLGVIVNPVGRLPEATFHT